MTPQEECALVGAAVLSAQKFEFALYGIVSHLSHLSEAKNEKRFRNLTPEGFLRGNAEEFKATLGQLARGFGDKLLLNTRELEKFVDDRNLIAHNYWRLTKSNIAGSEKLADPEGFLRNFLVRCDRWASIARGLVCLLMQGAADKEGRGSEINFDEQQLVDITAYRNHVAAHFLPMESKN